MSINHKAAREFAKRWAGKNWSEDQFAGVFWIDLLKSVYDIECNDTSNVIFEYHLMNAYYNDAYLLVNTEVHMEEIFWYWPMFRVLPTEIKNVQSTEEEYQAYVEAVAKAFGADPSEITDFRLGGKFIPSQNVIVYQSCDIYEALEYSDTIPYHLVLHEYLDGGELDKNERYQIFYSPDGKFVIAINGSLEKSYFSDCFAAFELYEYYQKISDLVG